jgi:DNA polymerase I
MKVVIDIEANALVNPTKIWCIVCKDIDTGEYHIFRKVTEDVNETQRWLAFASRCSLFIGHNWLGYDYPSLNRLGLIQISSIVDLSCDTLILSKLIDYSRKGHSIEDYGVEFGIEKGKFTDFSKYSKEMEDYCVRDVDICHRIYSKYARYINNPAHHPSILLEHKFQLVVNALHDSGFSFNSQKAQSLLSKVETELAALDKDILEAFPPRLTLIREITPKETKYGTLAKTDFRWLGDADISEYNGGPFCRCSWEPFNPSSHKQIVAVLQSAGWRPVDKTKTHIDTERELNRLRYTRQASTELDLRKKQLIIRLEELQKTGWQVNENNLDTLPPTAPKAARLLAKRILLESRRRTLTEWLGLVGEDARIHGKFYGIGAWTHRMAHQNPNTANIPKEFDTNGKKKLLGKELRQLWCAPKGKLLVGVDAAGIQLRIFAHYINDPEFTYALVEGKKENGSDPHSLNQRILGSVCKTRDAAKRFIFAYLLGAGVGKLAEILDCSEGEGRAALDNLVERYSGLATLKETIIPSDAQRGWFVGLDGRRVRILGDTVGQRKHLAMSGYLQNGEQAVVKETTIRTLDRCEKEDYVAILVNVVHDEVVIEVPNDVRRAEYVSQIFCEEIHQVGVDWKLNCPLAGEGHVGLNWYEIH